MTLLRGSSDEDYSLPAELWLQPGIVAEGGDMSSFDAVHLPSAPQPLPLMVDVRGQDIWANRQPFTFSELTGASHAAAVDSSGDFRFVGRILRLAQGRGEEAFVFGPRCVRLFAVRR